MLVVRGDKDHRRGVFHPRDVPRELEPVHARHADVKQQHLRGARRQALERFDAVLRLAGHRVRHLAGDVLQELAQALARRRLVIGDEDPDHVRR